LNRIVIIGSGAAGLTCGWRLARWGYAVHLVERTTRLGGVVATLAEKELRFLAASPVLQRLLSAGALSRAALSATPIVRSDDAEELRRQRAHRFSPLWRGPTLLRSPWWLARLAWWGSKSPGAPIASWVERAAPPSRWVSDLATLAEAWAGESLTTLTWSRFAPLVRAILFTARHGRAAWRVDELPSEWFAVALARSIGRLGQTVAVATPVTAVLSEAKGWRVVTPGEELLARAVVIATPPAAAAALLPEAFAALRERLTRWPEIPRWEATAPLPQPVAKPVEVAANLWLAGEWLPPEGALPGLEGAAASGWSTARAVRESLLRE